MGIVVKQFNGSSVTPKDDAVMNELIFQSYGIFNGCGISFLGVNQLMINSGRMIIKGRQVVITEETIAAQLSSGGTKRGRLYIRMDLSSPDTPAVFLTQVADELPVLTQQDDVNYNDGIFEIELCNYDVSETAISNIVESCPMITGSVDMLKSMEELLANTEEGKAVDSLVVKQLASSLGKLDGYNVKVFVETVDFSNGVGSFNTGITNYSEMIALPHKMSASTTIMTVANINNGVVELSLRKYDGSNPSISLQINGLILYK